MTRGGYKYHFSRKKKMTTRKTTPSRKKSFYGGRKKRQTRNCGPFANLKKMVYSLVK